MYLYSDIGLNRFRVCLDFVSNLGEVLEGGFATDWSEVVLVKYGAFVIDIVRHGGWRR